VAHFNDLFHTLEFSSAQAISSKLMEYYLQRKFDKVLVIYNEFKSAMQQKIEVEQFLPITPVSPAEGRFAVGFIYEPGPERILKELCPLNLNIQMWRILLESNASELGARMTAMETATDNAQDMINELVLYYNKARQAAITKELNEIVGGAEALRG
ncbi:F0F1 ATP synthase subunit gamma, partial [candidate division KSB1 bacterium]|nr:F0F1 ATP synthase subunit gamma [candidate division KSB1 bacterium]